jgi:uncharacterized protein YbaP (TraB family)
MILNVKRTAAALFGVLLISGATIRAADDTGDKTFLWKVSSDSNYVYLLGSVHVATKALYPLPKSIEDAFAKSTNLVLEVDESKADPAAMQKTLMEKGIYPAGDSIMKHLSKDGQKTLNDYLEKNGADLGAMAQMKPWLLAVQITAEQLVKLGLDPSQGVDKHFLAEAQKADKKVLELESVEFQLGALSGFSDDLQEKFLISSILETGTIKTEFEKLLDCWKKGDAETMDKLLFKQLVEHPDLKPVFEKLFYERNIGMTDKIEGYLKTKEPHFVVMGSGHLVGDRGILKLLADKKYKIEQIGKSDK